MLLNFIKENLFKLIGLVIAILFAIGLVMYFINFNHYIIQTNSMTPIINANDFVAINKNYNFNDLEEEDIIAFKADIFNNDTKEVVIHYIYNIDSDGNIQTISNVDQEPDEWLLTENDIVGEYSYRIPNIGRVFNFLTSPIGIIVIALNLSVLGVALKFIFTSKE